MYRQPCYNFQSLAGQICTSKSTSQEKNFASGRVPHPFTKPGNPNPRENKDDRPGFPTVKPWPHLAPLSGGRRNQAAMNADFIEGVLAILSMLYACRLTALPSSHVMSSAMSLEESGEFRAHSVIHNSGMECFC